MHPRKYFILNFFINEIFSVENFPNYGMCDWAWENWPYLQTSLYWWMWLDLRKAGFHAHKSMTYFSPSNDSCTHELTIQAVMMLKVAQAAFGVACFWGLSDVYKCSGYLQIAPYPLDKQTGSCSSSHYWLMSLVMDLAALCEMWK